MYFNVNIKSVQGINDVYFYVNIKVNKEEYLVNKRATHIIHVNGMLVIKRRHMPALHEVNMQ